MATFTVRPEGIIRQPALTMPGNATGSEAACTSLTASQIRTLLSLGTTSDVTFDIVRATTSVLSPLFNNPAAAATTLGNSTYGVTVPGAMGVGGANTGGKQLEVNGTGDIYLRSAYPTVQMFESGGTGGQAYLTYYLNKIRLGTFDGTGPWRESFIIEQSAPANSLVISSAGAATFSGDISMSKTSAQGYLYAYNTAGTRAARLYQNGNHSYFDNTGGNIYIRPTAAAVVISTPGLNTITYFANTDDTQYVSINYTSISSTGNLNLVPTGGTVAVTGGITASGQIIANGGTYNRIQVNDTSGTGYAGIAFTDDVGSASIRCLAGELRVTAGLYSSSTPIMQAKNTGTIHFSNSTNLYGTGKANVEVSAGTATALHILHRGAFTTEKAISVTGGAAYTTPETFAVAFNGNITCAGITASGAIQETYRTSSLDPTTSDIGSGKRQGWYNTSSLEFRDWVNVGGTLYKSATYT